MFALVNVAWMAERTDLCDCEFALSTLVARGGNYMLAGLLLGVVMRELKLARHEVLRRFRRSDSVARFAIEAPRLGVDEAAERLAEILHEDLGYERTAIVIAHETKPDTFRLVATTGYEHVDLGSYREFPVDWGIVGRCYRTGAAQFLEDVTTEPDYLEIDPETRSEMTVPLRSGDSVFGAIDVAATVPAFFGPEDLQLLETVATQVGRAFDNARLAEMERRTIEQLEALSAMKDDFISIANHELRTPVTTIAGFAQSLLKQWEQLDREELTDALERIARQSIHLRSLVEDLLTVPVVEADSVDVDIRPLCLAEVTTDVMREIDPRDGVHHLQVDQAADLPLVDADAAAVRRVLVNLLNNAVQYSPEGGAIRVRMRRDDGHVCVEVEDEGVGIHAEDVPLLFQKFGRLRQDGSAGGGMGLGLFLVKALVEQMHGSVGVESTPGDGSTFWFTLPVAEQAEGRSGASDTGRGAVGAAHSDAKREILDAR